MFCPACRHSNPDGSMSCSKCGSPLAMAAAPASSGQVGSAAAPATATVNQSTNSPALAAGCALAGIGDRAIATLLDIVVAASPFAVIGMWAAVRWGGVTPNGFELHGIAALFTISLVVILWFLYVWLLEGLLGATLGKFILNLRVRRLDGSGIGLPKSLVRNLSRVVDGIGVYLVGFLIANFSDRKKRLGDHLAGTVVVQGDSGKATRAIAAIAWAAIIIACFLGAYRLHPGAGAAAPLTTASTSIPSQATPLGATLGTQPRVTRAELGTDSTDTFQIIGSAAEFYTDTEKIVCVWEIAGTDFNKPLKSVWIAEDVGNAAPPNYQLAAKSMSGVNEGKFYVTSPANGWPIGKYRLEIYIGDTLAKQVPFSIKRR
jgi:uncharacterized RDD family membrane protein YckC